jgi:WD40 repeat protein
MQFLSFWPMDSPVKKICLSHSGKFLAASFENGNIFIADLVRNVALATICDFAEGNEDARYKGQKVKKFDFSADELNLILVTDKGLMYVYWVSKNF